MTWRELFRRAWLVLRLRFKRFHVCEECDDIEEPREAGSIAGVCTFWTCPSCEEFARLEAAAALPANVCPHCGAKASGSWAFADTAYCVGVGGCGAIIRRGPHPFAAALQNQPRAIDPALLQNLIGVPIRVPSKSALNAIGSAIDRFVGCNPLP